jgi:hypothetical protein
MVSRGSDSFVWGIRWQTVGREDHAPITGAELPGIYPSLGEAQRVQRQLEEQQPMQVNPLGGVERRRVHYVIFARQNQDEEADGI